MKAIRIERHGGADELKLLDVEPSALGPRDLRIKHESIGVNFIDVYHRTGLYKIPLPNGVGLEAAGVVADIGEKVTRFRPGDRVGYCSGPIGAYAEMHTVDEMRAVKLPEHISYDIAAASLLKGMTARYLLRKTFRVEQNHAVLIHAAAGGVGQILVQWAKHLGAFVIAAVGSEAKAQIAHNLGADHVIVTSKGNIASSVRAAAPEGVHVVYDGVGKGTFEASLDSLRPLGMMVSYGNASGPVPPFSPLLLQQKGSLFLTRPTLFHYTASVEQLDETAADLFDVIGKGVVTLAPPTRYALADAPRAHRDLESRETTGSLVLIP